VTHVQAVQNALAACAATFGSVDIVCNNAGIGGEGDLFGEEGPWRAMLDINLRAVIEGTRLAVRAMRAAGGGGVIVNTASMGGLLPMPGSPVYAATKAGVINFTRSLAYLSAEGIRVNAICPSFTDTPLVYRDNEGARIEEVKQQMGGILSPETIAEGLIQLVEDDSRAGAIMRVTLQRGIDYAREIRP
jgi:NAD(P)-dependent dehydrogenase (short-subunit alcohol dehydrogenase family)